MKAEVNYESKCSNTHSVLNSVYGLKQKKMQKINLHLKAKKTVNYIAVKITSERSTLAIFYIKTRCKILTISEQDN